MYCFIINGTRPFESEHFDLPSDEMAWREARGLVREVEDHLAPGESWELEVRKDQRPIFQINVKSVRLS